MPAKRLVYQRRRDTGKHDHHSRQVCGSGKQLPAVRSALWQATRALSTPVGGSATHGLTVRIDFTVRRKRCATEGCNGTTFSETFQADLMRPHGRRTVRLQRQVRYLGLVLGGRPAQALATRLLLRVSKDRFLRIDRHLADDPAFRPRSVGIDDWAWRRGQRYGTLICDLERRRVIDLLSDGNPATVEAWLRDHPQIKVVARDRNGGFGGAVSRALTGAVHVADDWHMLE